MKDNTSQTRTKRREFLKRAAAAVPLSITAAVPAVFVPGSSQGAKGKVYPDQRRKYRDSRTSRIVWQMTDTPGCISHAQYFTQPAATPDGRWLVYGSGRGGPAGQLNLFKMDLRTGVSVQLTESVRNLKPRWSHISPDGKEVYYIEDSNRVKAVNMESLEERDICRIAGCRRPHQLSVSPDNRFLLDGVFLEDKDEDNFLVGQGFLIRSAVVMIDARTGAARNLLDGNTPRTHAQYCPTDANLLFYCYGGPWWRVQRLWLIHADGTGNRPIFLQTNFEGLGHEFWSDDGKVVYATCNGGRQPQGIWALDLNSGAEWCVLAGACVGHGTANGEQDRFVIDELYNDCKTGLYMARKGKSEPELLCQTGADWAGKAQEYHPHPRFLPDGKTVSFTSAMSGSSEVYLVEL